MRSESELILASQAGDLAAAERLARRHFAPAWRAAYAITGARHLADDAVQDAFERAFRTIGRVDPARPFAPWLHRIVANCSITAASRGRSAGPLDETTADLSGDPEFAALTAEALEALQALDPPRRAVLVLRLLLGYSPAEAAELLGVAEGTVHSRLSRGMDDLRRELGVRDGR